jgi:hypothetical protein
MLELPAFPHFYFSHIWGPVNGRNIFLAVGVMLFTLSIYTTSKISEHPRGWALALTLSISGLGFMVGAIALALTGDRNDRP